MGRRPATPPPRRGYRPGQVGHPGQMIAFWATSTGCRGTVQQKPMQKAGSREEGPPAARPSEIFPGAKHRKTGAARRNPLLALHLRPKGAFWPRQIGRIIANFLSTQIIHCAYKQAAHIGPSNATAAVKQPTAVAGNRFAERNCSRTFLPRQTFLGASLERLTNAAHATRDDPSARERVEQNFECGTRTRNESTKKRPPHA